MIPHGGIKAEEETTQSTDYHALYQVEIEFCSQSFGPT
jgi:hypothetical protein